MRHLWQPRPAATGAHLAAPRRRVAARRSRVAARRSPPLALFLVVGALVVASCGNPASPSAAPVASPTAAASATPANPASATPVVSPAPSASAAPAGIVLAMADVPRAAPGPTDLHAASTLVNAFAVDLLHESADGNNLVFSPTSIVTALAMARAGARGTTATEMDAVLHDRSLEALLAAVNALDVALAGRSGWVNDQNEDPPVAREITLRSVNAAFGQAGYPLETNYLDTLAAQFGAGLRLVDFRADPDASRRLINAWVADRTEQRIKELLAGPTVDSSTRMVLVNAVYLKAPWESPFDPGDTRKGSFTRADGTKVSVPFMHLVSSGLGPTLPAATGKGWAAVRLPYLGQQLAMTIIVPDDLEAFEKTLTAARLAELTQLSYEGSQKGVLEDRKVDLSLPRFSLASDLDLGETLATMGMPTAFDPTNADFTGIASPDRTGEPGLHIAKVIHQANIDVDEKGTEAAAATAVSMATGGPGDESKPIVIRADRPFLFVLTDVPSGTVLFLGRVADPAAG